MAEARSNVVCSILKKARNLHGKHDMFEDFETLFSDQKTSILIFGFKHMITKTDLEVLRTAMEKKHARIHSLGVLPEKVGPTQTYNGVIEIVFSMGKRSSLQRSNMDDNNEDEEDGRPKRRHGFAQNDNEEDSGLGSLFSQLRKS